MSEDIVIAVVSAMIGAVAGGLTAWFAGKRQAASSRAWEIAMVVSEVQGEILSASLPNGLTFKHVQQLQADWHVAHRRFYILGHQDSANKVTKKINEYLGHLQSYVEGDINRETLEEKRILARDEVTEIMSKFGTA